VRAGARERSLLLEVLRSSAFLVGTELATRAVSLLTTLYLARTLARDGVGLVESGLALFAVLQVADDCRNLVRLFIQRVIFQLHLRDLSLQCLFFR